MKKSKLSIVLFVSTLAIFQTYGQTNNLTGSPYSLFGLGTDSNAGLGKYRIMGSSGISLQDPNSINVLNPSSFASIGAKNFLFDVGGYAEVDRLSNSGEDDETRIAGNFSNVAFAFNASGKLGMGLSLIPATNVGYSLIGLTSTVEGSNETYRSNVLGTGGVNDISYNIGYAITDKLNIGAKASYLFGRIEETEAVFLGEQFLNISEISRYRNFRFGFGAQYKINETFAFGAIVDLPTELDGKQDRTVRNSLDGSPSTAEETTDNSIDDFQLPLELGVGFSTSSFKRFMLSVDFRRKYWDNTVQEDLIGRYIDQEIYRVGLEYIKNKNSLQYKDRINYRFGFEYDTGYLEIDDINVDNFTLSAGMGFPLGNKGTLNFGYSYSKNGSVGGVLVEESVHTLSFNFTLMDKWFQKRYYD